METALKMALQYWRQQGQKSRTRFLSLPGAYHGDTVGAMSVSAIEEFKVPFFPVLFDTRCESSPTSEKEWNVVFERLIETIRKNADTIAAVIVEPIVQGANQMEIYPPRLLHALAGSCREVDTFLIADEVFTGFGRTGPMWASEHADIVPDILCMGKGMTGGMLPFAATIVTERIYRGFEEGSDRAFLHGHTFCGNPLGASAALEVLSIYRDESILEKAKEKSRILKRGIQEIACIKNVTRPRSLGMIGAVSLGQDGYAGKKGWILQQKARKHGVYLRPLGDTVYLVPPLNIDDRDLHLMIESIKKSIAEMYDVF